MRIELLYSEGCPHHAAARERVERILARRGLKVPVELVRGDGAGSTAAARFLGSPTLLVNGKDVEVARRGDKPASGSRTYEGVQEGRSPLPPLSWIEGALADALVDEGAEAIHCSAAPKATVRGDCPACGEKGKPTWHVTLESLLTPEAFARLGPEAHLYCPNEACDVVYFAPETGNVFRKKDLLVRAGPKEKEAPRPICYCFGHSVETIEEEVRRTGESTAQKRITEAMKNGCRCQMTRPLGACCLGDVTRAGQEAKKKLAAMGAPAAALAAKPSAEEGDSCCAPFESRPAAAEADACCATKPAAPPARGAARTGLLAAGASVVSAVVASACCWLPLLLVAFGASAAGVSAAFDRVRPYFLAGAAVLLGAGYYFVFLRKEECAPGSACAVPSRPLERFNKGTLLLATALVLAIAFFPSYVGALVGAGQPSPAHATAAPPSRLRTMTLEIEGMTCEGCSVHVRKALAAVPGVESAEVRFEEATARVRFDAGSPPSTKALLSAVEGAGYHASATSDAR